MDQILFLLMMYYFCLFVLGTAIGTAVGSILQLIVIVMFGAIGIVVLFLVVGLVMTVSQE